MDVFSDVVATMKAGRPKLSRSQRSGRWGSRFGPYPGAGFHVVLAGGCWLITSSDAPVRLATGDVVFLPHGAMHGMSDSPDRPLENLPLDRTTGQLSDVVGHSASGDAHASVPAADTLLLCGAYRLERGQAHPFLRALPEVIHLPARLGRNPALRSAVDLLSADVTEGRPGTDAALPALLELLLIYLLRAWLDDQALHRPDAGWCAALSDPAVAAALNHMHRDPARSWTVRELAGEVGLSRTVFAARFTSYVGQSPMAYLTWWRLSTAARLLRDNDAPLISIARQVGYGSEFAFAHAFKRQFGRPPGRFRKDHAALAATDETGTEPTPLP
ncbi:AraC family transcriptional regulator [Streptomyces sp. 8N706]|uniref:AraC family transcriptional regulator n=1 Tax=Streptomyces sp. 8N706 TaxID=3457416 RepID=UPI003FD14A80